MVHHTTLMGAIFTINHGTNSIYEENGNLSRILQVHVYSLKVLVICTYVCVHSRVACSFNGDIPKICMHVHVP